MTINLNNDGISVNSSKALSGTEKVSTISSLSTNNPLPISGKSLPKNTAIAQEDTMKKPIDPKKLDAAVKVLNEEVQAVYRELHFSVDKESGNTVIKVMDLATKEVIRQIPNEEALSVARTLSDGEGLKLFSRYT